MVNPTESGVKMLSELCFVAVLWGNVSNYFFTAEVIWHLRMNTACMTLSSRGVIAVVAFERHLPKGESSRVDSWKQFDKGSENGDRLSSPQHSLKV